VEELRKRASILGDPVMQERIRRDPEIVTVPHVALVAVYETELRSAANLSQVVRVNLVSSSVNSSLASGSEGCDGSSRVAASPPASPDLESCRSRGSEDGASSRHGKDQLFARPGAPGRWAGYRTKKAAKMAVVKGKRTARKWRRRYLMANKKNTGPLDYDLVDSGRPCPNCQYSVHPGKLVVRVNRHREHFLGFAANEFF
jgi:hypothetical protein